MAPGSPLSQGVPANTLLIRHFHSACPAGLPPGAARLPEARAALRRRTAEARTGTEEAAIEFVSYLHLISFGTLYHETVPQR